MITIKKEINNYFYQEVKKTNICPPNFDRIFNDFNNYQDMILKVLYEVHRICEKNEIHYCLAYGSLLGLIRDHGQIPWDYDVDIFVPYIEKKAFIEFK